LESNSTMVQDSILAEKTLKIVKYL